jgi:hypothetical protein
VNDTMPGPVMAAQLQRAVAGMLEDPDVRGDLLVVGVALVWHTTCGQAPHRLEDAVVNTWDGGRGECLSRALSTLTADIPRYVGGDRGIVGGALARHLPRLDWLRIWDEIAPTTEAHARPHDTGRAGGLRLYLGTGEPPCPVKGRPALTVVRP